MSHLILVTETQAVFIALTVVFIVLVCVFVRPKPEDNSPIKKNTLPPNKPDIVKSCCSNEIVLKEGDKVTVRYKAHAIEVDHTDVIALAVFIKSEKEKQRKEAEWDDQQKNVVPFRSFLPKRETS